MTKNLEDVYEQLASLKTDLEDLRNTYKGVSNSYSFALGTLSELTFNSAEAAKRASLFTEQSRIAASNAMIAAKEASIHPGLITIVELSVTASVAASLAAIESAAAAASAADAAAKAVTHQAEESLLKASAEASQASKLAASSAAEAVKLSLEAKNLVSWGGLKNNANS